MSIWGVLTWHCSVYAGMPSALNHVHSDCSHVDFSGHCRSLFKQVRIFIRIITLGSASCVYAGCCAQHACLNSGMLNLRLLLACLASGRIGPNCSQPLLATQSRLRDLHQMAPKRRATSINVVAAVNVQNHHFLWDKSVTTFKKKRRLKKETP